MPRTVLGVATKIYVSKEQSFSDLVGIERLFSRDRFLLVVMVLSIARHRIALILPLIGYYHLVCTVDPSWSLWKHSASFRGSCRYWGVPHVCIGRYIDKKRAKRVMGIFHQLLWTKRPCWFRKIRDGSNWCQLSWCGIFPLLYGTCLLPVRVHWLWANHWDIDIRKFSDNFIIVQSQPLIQTVARVQG